MFKQKLTFKNSRNLNLSAIFEGENPDESLVVMCHGLESSKDGFSTRSLAQKLVEKGISVFRFDFTGRGYSEGNFDDLTPLQGLDDLKSAVKTLKQKEFGLYGSSFGGYTSLMYAGDNPVISLALKAPVSDYAFVVSEEISERRQRFIEETRNINIFEKAKNIKCPVLIIHGDADEEVPIAQSSKLFESLRGEKTLEILPGAGHVMSNEDIEKTSTLIADFFVKTLLH